MGKRIGRDGRAYARRMDGAAGCGTRQFWRRSLFGLIVLLLLSFSLCYAATYVYDGNGRLVAVTSDDGTSSRYVYDAVGNLQQVVAVPAGQLAIFGFAPNHGSPDEEVTISGQGFDPTAASNTVKFNGTTAAVTAATATTLSVLVPAGATTGPIAVTVASQTATSTEPFVVDGTGLPPVITSFSPAIVGAGTAVTVVGKHLDPVTGQTSVAVNGQSATPTAMADTQITFPVPTQAGSGHISVETPYGLALSSTDLVVAPAGINPADILTEERISVGGTQSLTIPTAGKYGVLLFDASNSSWLSFQLNSLTTTASNVHYTVYDPQNHAVTNGTVSAAAPSIHLPRLRLTGTYSIYFQPDTAAATLSVSLEAAPLLSVDAPVTTLVTSVANQSRRYVFQAAQAQTLALRIASLSTLPAGGSVSIRITSPSGAQVVSTSASGIATLNLPGFPQNGTYQVLFVPPSNATENLSFQVVSGVSGQLTIDGPSQTFATSVPGLNAYLGFIASPGDNLELALSGVTTNPANSYVSFSVYAATGAYVTSGTCYVSNPAGSCNAHLWGLAGGGYTITVQPGNAGTMRFTATLTRDLVDTLSVGVTAAVNLPRPGQNERLSFAGTAGQTLALSFAGVTTSPAGNSVTFTLYRPDGTTWTSANVTASGVLNLPNLPSTGNYLVEANPSYGLPASASVALVAGVTGTLIVDGPSQSFATTAPGQNAYLNFTSAAGDNLELAFNGVTSSASNGSLSFNVYNASGNYVTSTTCYVASPASSCRAHLWGLAAGTYSLVVQPQNAASTMGFTATLTRDIVGALTPGQTMPLALSRPGQTARLTFDGTVGENVSISFTGGTTPAGNVTVTVNEPDGTELTSKGVVGSNTLNLPNLPVAGTYTVIVSPDYGLPASLNATLNAGGTLTVDGPSQAFDGMTGQIAYDTFTANAGANLELALNGVASSVQGGYAQLSVYTASGANVASQSCYTTSAAGSCSVHLWGLVGGTYTVTVTPAGGSVPSAVDFTATLTSDLAGTLTAGQALAVPLSRPGQTTRLTFDGTAGQNVSLGFVGDTTPNGNPYDVTVLGPAGASSSTTSLTGSNTLNLPNLAATGAYTVIVSPRLGLPASFQVTLNAPQTLIIDGPSLTYDGMAGENAYLNFTASSGDNLELALSGVNASGGGKTSLTVYDPSGAVVVNALACNASQPASSCRTHLWGLAGGTYTVVVVPAGDTAPSTMNFTATLTRDLVGTLTPGQALPLALARPGQTARLGFSGTAGENATIGFTGTTTPAGNVTVTVNKPDGTSLTTSGIAGSNAINLPNLPASGAYTVIVSPDYGLPANLNVTLNVGGALTIDGPSQPFAGMVGQNAYLTFTAATGDDLELAFNALSLSTGSSVNVSIYNAAGTLVANTAACSTTNPAGSCSLHLWQLAAGDYTVVVVPSSGGTPSSMEFGATLTRDVIGTLTSGSAQTLSLQRPGQTARLTFNGTIDQTAVVALKNLTTTPSTGNVAVQVINPDGSVLMSWEQATDTVKTLPLLPATGTYTVVVSPDHGLPAQATITLTAGTTTPITVDGDAVNGTTTGGQGASLYFNAAAGDNLELTVTGLTTSSGGNVDLAVYDGSGRQVASVSCSPSPPAGNCDLHLWGLDGGAYTIVLPPPSINDTIGYTAILTRDIAKALVVGSTVAVNMPKTGQTTRLTFDATAGEAALINLSNVTLASGSTMLVTVYPPGFSSWMTWQMTSGGSFMPNLPVTGTYTVTITTDTGAPMSANVTLMMGVAASLSVNGASQTISTVPPAQSAAFLGFTASAGDNLELALGQWTSSVSSGANVVINDASGNYVTSASCTVSTTAGVCNIQLFDLAGGSYTAIVTPGDASSALGFTAALTRDVTGALTAGQTTSVNLAQPDQSAALTFDASANQAFSLNLSNVVTSPAGSNVIVTIYNPGNMSWTIWTVSGNASIPLSLSVAGTYTVVISADNGQPMSADVALAGGGGGVSESLTVNGAAQTVTTTPPGQSAADLSFTASAGDNLELALGHWTSSVSSGANVVVNDASGNYVTNASCTVSTTAGVCNIQLFGLAAGAYTAVVTPGDSSSALGFTAALTRDVTSALTVGQAKAVSLAQPYQSAALTFSATANQTLNLNLSNITTSPSGTYVIVTIYAPGYMSWTIWTVPGNASIPLSLSTTGTYTAVISADNGQPMSASAELQ